jgi:hypothetical protein
LAPSRLRLALDFASDWAVLAYAVWTLIAYGGMATHAHASLLVSVWLIVTPLLGALLFVLRRRWAAPTRVGARAATARPRVPGALLAGSVAGALVSAILASAAPGIPWPLLWLPALAAVALAIAAGRLRFERADVAERIQRWPADALAAAIGLGFAAMSLFINDQNADDVFYVNRATATAQLNRIPIRDVIFTDERATRLGGTGLPVDTFSALQGAVGRLLGVQGASVAYYVTPPLLTFLATWALWRLLRSWAPGRTVLCFVLSCVFLVWSAQFDLSAGNFFLTRMWQGKVIFVAWLLPTLYTYLTRWLGRRDALTAVLLMAAGVCSIGLTSSATFVVPLIIATAALPLLVGRDWGGLPVLVATAGFPFLVGFVATRRFPLGDRFPVGVLSTEWYYQAMFGVGVVGVLAGLAVWAAPWLARAGPAAAITTGIAVVAVVLLAPYAFRALNEVSGLTGSRALRRTLWVIPFPALVGLLAGVPVVRALEEARAAVPSAVRRLAPALPALVVGALLVGFGHPLWLSRGGDSHWVSRPVWKTNPSALRTARGILHRYDGEGAVLADQRVMKAIALLTVAPKAVNARTWYALLTREPARRTQERLALTRLIMSRDPRPSSEEIRRALTDLRVGVVCVPQGKPDILDEIEAAGPYREGFRVRQQECLVRSPGVPRA